MDNVGSENFPPYEGGVDAAAADGVVHCMSKTGLGDSAENHPAAEAAPLLRKEESPEEEHRDASGQQRHRIVDLERGVDGYGRTIFIEREDEYTGRPIVWYSRDRRRVFTRHERTGPFTIMRKRLNTSERIKLTPERRRCEHFVPG